MFNGEKQKIQTNPLKHNPHKQIYNCQLFGFNSIRFYNIYNIYLYKHISFFKIWGSCVFYNLFSLSCYCEHMNIVINIAKRDYFK